MGKVNLYKRIEGLSLRKGVFSKIFSIKEFGVLPYEELMKNFTQLKNL